VHQTSTAKDKSEDGLHFQSDLLWFFVFWGWHGTSSVFLIV